MTDTENFEARANMYRALIFEGNKRGYTAEQVDGLIVYAAKYGPEVMGHPSFPLGILISFEDTAEYSGDGVD